MAFVPDSRLHKDNANLFLDLVKMRQEKNMDSVIVVVGERRSGKSYGAITIAEKLSKMMGKKFIVATNMFFEPIEFLKRFNQIEKEVIILDEASESIDSRQWYDIANKIFNSLIMREGFKNNVIIMTFPVLSDLDKRALRLSSHLITMLGHNSEQKVSYGMAYRLKPIHLMGKSSPRKIQLLKIGLPTDENRTVYDQMKRDWNAKKSGDNITTMEMLLDPETFKKPLPRDDYIEAFRREKIDEEHFAKNMSRLGVNDDDIDMLILMNRKEEKVKVEIPPPPKTQEELDGEEFMNARQQIEIDFMKQKNELELQAMRNRIEEQKLRRALLDADLQSKMRRLDDILEPVN